MGDPQHRQNWKLTLAYDGTDFFGWQVQPGLRTIQGELAAAVERITRERVLPQGSGRTDAGVHALGQVASLEIAAPIPPCNLRRALNRTLPASIRVLSCDHAAAKFHARHSARAKTYEYRIFRGDICPPLLARYVHALPRSLDIEAMRSAAVRLEGEHDFTSFAATDPDRAARSSTDSAEGADGRGNRRIVYESLWSDEPDQLIFRIKGNGFLHHMVRNLVGTLLEIGQGRWAETAIVEILKAHSRRAAGPTAPARGLYLVNVDYELDIPAQVC